MIYDEGIETLYSLLKEAEEGFSIRPDATVEEMEEKLPAGWRGKDLLWPVILFSSRFPETPTTTIKILKGLLRPYPENREARESVLYDLIAQISARKSATICKICGKRGIRRKAEEFSPSLCQKHFIQYINYIAEHVI